LSADGRGRVNDALRIDGERFRAFVEHSPDALMLLDEAGRIVYATPSVSRHCGWAAEDLIGRSALDFLHPDDLVTLRAQPAGSFSSGAVRVPADLRVRQPDGGYRTLEGVAIDSLDDPAVRGIVVNVRDVTGRRLFEEQLGQAQKMEAVGRLAGGIAHDFNNLLTTILGYCNLLLEDVPAVTGMRSDLEEIRKAGDRAAVLTRQLLSFSRRQMLRPQPIELSACITRMDERLRELLGRRIDLVMTLAPRLPMVDVDPAAIEEILVNLALHARTALPNGGRLTIETAGLGRDGDVADRRVTPPAAGSGRVMIAVSDNGDGMDEATRSRIFEPLFTTRGKGTGLGLATVHSLVQQIGGSIEVESEPGHGTRFRISLPSLDPGASGATVPGSASPGAGSLPEENGSPG
jgi:two-component system cell cycle sensor histidine kinase/response regulator CckA